MTITVSSFLKKFDSKKDFSEKELDQLTWMPSGFELIETTEGAPDGRWTYPKEIYFKAGDRYFYMLQHIGLTELQEEETYCEQPVEMSAPVRKMKTIYYNEWVEKKTN